MAAPLVATTPCSTLTAQGNFVRVLIPSVRPLSSSSRGGSERNPRKLLQPLLEFRVNEGFNEGVQEAVVQNALMKIYIDTNNRPEEYLTTNTPRPRRVGDYCEKRDPQLFFLAYKHGMCDDELADDDATEYCFPHRDQARPLTTADSSGNPHIGTSLVFCFTKSKQFASLEEFISRRPTRRPHPGRMHTRPPNSSSIHLQTSRGSQRVPGAPRPAPGGRWRGVQGHAPRRAHARKGTHRAHKEFRLAQICAPHIVNPDEQHGLVDKDRKNKEAASASLS